MLKRHWLFFATIFISVICFADEPTLYTGSASARIYCSNEKLSFAYYQSDKERKQFSSFRVDLIFSQQVEVSNVTGVQTFEKYSRSGRFKFGKFKAADLQNNNAEIKITEGPAIPRVRIQRANDFHFTVVGAEALIIRNDSLFFFCEGTLLPVDLLLPDNIELVSSIVDVPVIYADRNTESWSTFLGGSLDDNITAMTVNWDNVFVCGSTTSPDLLTTAGAQQDSLAGYYDAFIAGYAREGDLLWITYFGGNNLDVANKIVSDLSGSVIVAGHTNSADFPVTANAWQDSIKGSYETFILKLEPSFGLLEYSGFFGGSGGDFLYGLAIDKSSNIYFGGGTSSLDLPVTSGVAQQTHGGALDAYVVKFDQNLQLKWCTYYGGAGAEDMHAMCADSSSSVIFCGGSFSPDFPTVNPFQTLSNGGMETYIVKLDSTGSVNWSSYYGGTGNDDGLGITTDSSRSIYLFGSTTSASLDFAGSSSHQVSNAGGYDTYVIKISPSGDLLRGTFFGGSGYDQATGCSFGFNKLWLTGYTSSADLDIDSMAFQQMIAGPDDAFYAVFDSTLQYIAAGLFGGNGQEVSSAIEPDSSFSFFIAGKTTSSDLPYVSAGNQVTPAGGDEGFVARLNYLDGPLRSNVKSKSKSAELYPVPAQAEITFDAQDLGRIEIVSIDGRVLRASAVYSGPNRIDISTLSPGMFFLIYYSGDRREEFRIIKN